MGKTAKWIGFIIMVGGLMAMAEEKDQAVSATLNIHFSNDIIGYLTPCG